MKHSTRYTEFASDFQCWCAEKGISLTDLITMSGLGEEEVKFLLCGRFPFSLSFLSKLRTSYPDFDLLRANRLIAKKDISRYGQAPTYWEPLKQALVNPEAVSKVVVFYKNGSYKEFC
jgi:hypothetical protein